MKDPIKSGKQTSGTHMPYWLTSAPAFPCPSLDRDLRVDVVIVGGGIAGISVAYELMRSGKKVAVVEDGEIGSGETGRTSAHLVFALDDRFFRLVERFGADDARIIGQSHRQAINHLEQVVKEEGIECEFERVPGYLFLDPTDEPDSLVKELRAAADAGLPVSRLDQVPGITGIGPCLKFEDQARFHPMKYLTGLAGAVIKGGGKIFTNTRAMEVTSEGIVTRTGHRITADHVVVATNSPVNDKYLIPLGQTAYRTYIICALVPKGSLPDALWWDTGNHHVNKDLPPYHYVRTERYDDNHDLLICGGEDHPTGITDDKNIPEEKRYSALEQWAKAHFPIERLVYRWSGQVMEPVDSVAYIGHDPFNKDNVYIVTGDSGNGLTHATIAGMLLSDLINGQENAWERIYSPSRFKLFTAGRTFASQLLSGLVSSFKTKPTSEHGLDAVPIGAGRVVEIDGRKYGAYKDADGACHVVDPECTHLKCTVKWNADEKTWDCPCHGSRFSYEGHVLNGPANISLNYHRIVPADRHQFDMQPSDGSITETSHHT